MGLSATLTAAEIGAVPAHVSLLLSKSLSSLPTDQSTGGHPTGGHPSGSMGAYVSGGASVSSHPSVQSSSSSVVQQGGMTQQVGGD